MSLPTTDAARKALPVFDGVLMYFPDAIMEIARVSMQGNDQHNPGEKLHWARGKSMDQFNTALRHMMDHGMGNRFDGEHRGEKIWHLAKAAWRNMAALQMAIEEWRIAVAVLAAGEGLPVVLLQGAEYAADNQLWRACTNGEANSKSTERSTGDHVCGAGAQLPDPGQESRGECEGPSEPAVPKGRFIRKRSRND
jgi:dATP/dGTP diphosphohydrolase